MPRSNTCIGEAACWLHWRGGLAAHWRGGLVGCIAVAGPRWLHWRGGLIGCALPVVALIRASWLVAEPLRPAQRFRPPRTNAYPSTAHTYTDLLDRGIPVGAGSGNPSRHTAPHDSSAAIIRPAHHSPSTRSPPGSAPPSRWAPTSSPAHSTPRFERPHNSPSPLPPRSAPPSRWAQA